MTNCMCGICLCVRVAIVMVLASVCLQSIQLNLQERLEKVWKSLHMPDSLKLDMAIKYSADTYHGMLEEVGGCVDS